MNRRQFLTTATAAAGAAAVGLGLPEVSKAQAQVKNTRPIDVHYHMWSPDFMDIGKQNGFTVSPGTPMFWDPAKTKWNLKSAIEHNEKYGVMGMCSVPGTTNWGPKPELWGRLARVSNEYNAKIRGDYPKLFGMWATLPCRDIDASLKEIEYACDTLKTDGFGLITNYYFDKEGIDRFHGDPYFDPIYAELNRRKAVVYVHPADMKCQAGVTPKCENVLAKGVQMDDYMIDTGRCMATLVLTGSTTKFPDIRWIFSHSGGITPSYFGRYIMHRSQPQPTPANYRGTAAEFKKFYYDTAQTYDPTEMRNSKEMWGISQIVFGSDYPYFSSGETAEGVKKCGIFNEAELKQVYYENLQKMVPRLKTIPA